LPETPDIAKHINIDATPEHTTKGYTTPTMADISQPTPGQFDWRLSAHPITFVTFLAFRAGMFERNTFRR
jgi:hypothetical protein